MLTDKEFWERVKNLEGKTIYSLTNNRPNTIAEVNDKCVHCGKDDPRAL